ncbi:MAG TPA: hemolysin family protein [Terriglobia bacterium]|nr:hemolysin family protein [Terriglobia bacterium]
MIFIGVAILALLVGASSVASYLRLLMRRLTPGAVRKLFEAGGKHRVRADRERVGISISALHGAAMAAFAAGLTALLFIARPAHARQNLFTSLLVVLGVIAICDQLIPFVLVARHDEPEVILERWMPFLRRAVYLALPLTFPVLVSSTISRLLEAETVDSEETSAQGNLQEFIEAGEEEGLIEKGEGEMLQSVVEFGDKVVREVMTPRPEIAAIEIHAPVEELRRLFRETRHSRFPVYAGQLDDIRGFVSVRDLMELPPEGQARVTLRSLVRPVPFVPETKRNADLLKELQQSTPQLAIVIDEHGSVAGLVTLEDLVEEIVGEIRDEVETHDRDIVKESEGRYLVKGQTELAQVVDELHLPVGPGEYSTVAGLVLARLGHVPSPGERLEEHGVFFEVLEANPRTVVKLRVTLPTGPAGPVASAGPPGPKAESPDSKIEAL